ncbi:hypothetical protein EJ110_NYTH23536 [Nymphaea thermarum]|nr:hypothetical protein EJ110_NYTH23536 [Nymphaea thermarum]
MKEFQHQYLLDRARDSAAGLHMQPHQYFFHHQQEGSRATNFMCKVATPEVEEMRSPAAAAAGGGGGIHEWVMLELSPPSCCRPLQTLELFPITSTGLKDEKAATNSPTSTTTECSSSKTDE